MQKLGLQVDRLNHLELKKSLKKLQIDIIEVKEFLPETTKEHLENKLHALAELLESSYDIAMQALQKASSATACV